MANRYTARSASPAWAAPRSTTKLFTALGAIQIENQARI
jgi:hypothetical protein